MFSKHHRPARRVIGIGLMGVGSFVAAPASAGDAQPALAEIVVTGSRIPLPAGETSVSPITTVSNQDIKLTGQISVENILDQLPQLVTDNNQSSNFPGNGIATLDLRGLGTNRNLILMDGRRVTPSLPDGTVDVNNIPVEMIQRVEIVTGGASSTYGSDAMSGVVNFILKKNFTGIEVTANSGISSHGDGVERGASVLMGTGSGGGNIMMGISYFSRDSILEAARPFSRVDVAALIGDSTSAGGFPWQGGSPSGTPSIVNEPNNPSPRTSTGITLSDGTNCNAVFGPSRTLVPTATGVRGFCQVISSYGGDRYNFAPVSDLVIPQSRWTVDIKGHVPIADGAAEAYTNVLYVHDETANQRAPSALGAYTGITIAPTSPFLNTATQTALAARPDPTAPAYLAARLTAFGPQIYQFNTDYAQFSGGVRGDLPKHWKWNLYGSYSQVQFTTIFNDVARNLLQQEFNGCPAGSASGCIAQSPFAPYSPAAVSWANLPNVTDRSDFQRTDVALDLNGNVLELPAGPLQAAVGTEFRRDSTSYTPDSQQEALNGLGNLIGGFAALPVSGAFNVKEGYLELQAPVVKVEGVKSLTLQLGGRLSDYSSVGTIDTAKAGFELQPDSRSGLRVRGMFQIATRAPSLAELYAAPSQSRPGIQDPCDSRFYDGTAATASRCDGSTPVIGANGVPIAPVDPTTFQALNILVNTYSVGNTHLRPETAHTVTFGVDWRPAYVPNLYASVDYYRISIGNYIASEFGGPQAVVNACYQGGDANACRLLSRDPSGTLIIGNPATGLGIQPENSSSLLTAGEDIDLNYHVGLSRLRLPGEFAVALNLNHLDTWLYTAQNGSTTQCAGAMCASSTSFQTQPKWRALLSATYSVSGLTAQWRMRYVGSVADSMLGGQDFLSVQNGGVSPVIGSYAYHDLSVGYHWSSRASLTLTVDNVFDKQPPVLYDAGSQDNTDVNLYDVIGRYFHLAAQVRF